MMILWKYEKSQVAYNRFKTLALIFALLFFILTCRLFYLQVFQSDKYRLLADKNRITVRPILPSRGLIFDRNGVKIAENKKTFQALFKREQIKDYQVVLNNFSRIVPLMETEKERIIKEIKSKRPFMPVPLKENLSYETMAKIALNAPDLPGVFIEEGISRRYPLNENTTHVLGYLRVPSEEVLQENKFLQELVGYKVGYAGLEKVLEERLRGTPGLLKSEINAFGRTVRVLDKTDPVAGENITLTLDARLQQYGMKLFENQAGAAIMMDIRNGDILMLLSAPSFDANVFNDTVSAEQWEKLNNDKKRPLTNKAISGLYSPGSIFKIVVALAGLESHDIQLEKKEYCSGKINLGTRLFHCWKHHGHGALNIIGALRESCDVFFYKKAQDIGVDKIVQTAAKLGFGKKTDIELPGEKAGLLPSRQWKKLKKNDDWRMGDTFNLSIGQGFLMATPMQMLTAVATVASGGTQVRPHLVKEETPVLKKQVDITPYHLSLVRKGMDEVVNAEHGTAYWSRFSVNGQTMAGKTASTQVRGISLKERLEGLKKQEELPWEWRDHGMFVAFAPVDHPRYVVVVVVEHGGGGSKAAAPIASKLLKKMLQLENTDEGK